MIDKQAMSSFHNELDSICKQAVGLKSVGTGVKNVGGKVINLFKRAPKKVRPKMPGGKPSMPGGQPSMPGGQPIMPGGKPSMPGAQAPAPSVGVRKPAVREQTGVFSQADLSAAPNLNAPRPKPKPKPESTLLKKIRSNPNRPHSVSFSRADLQSTGRGELLRKAAHAMRKFAQLKYDSPLFTRITS